MKIETFKTFVRSNPQIFDAIVKNQLSWQKAYEAYDIFGEKAELFSAIINEPQPVITEAPKQSINLNTINSFISNLDVDKVNHLVDQLSKGITILRGVLPDSSTSKGKEKQVFERFND